MLLTTGLAIDGSLGRIECHLLEQSLETNIYPLEGSMYIISDRFAHLN